MGGSRFDSSESVLTDLPAVLNSQINISALAATSMIRAGDAATKQNKTLILRHRDHFSIAGLPLHWLSVLLCFQYCKRSHIYFEEMPRWWHHWCSNSKKLLNRSKYFFYGWSHPGVSPSKRLLISGRCTVNNLESWWSTIPGGKEGEGALFVAASQPTGRIWPFFFFFSKV